MKCDVGRLQHGANVEAMAIHCQWWSQGHKPQGQGRGQGLDPQNQGQDQGLQNCPRGSSKTLEDEDLSSGTPTLFHHCWPLTGNRECSFRPWASLTPRWAVRRPAKCNDMQIYFGQVVAVWPIIRNSQATTVCVQPQIRPNQHSGTSTYSAAEYRHCAISLPFHRRFSSRRQSFLLSRQSTPRWICMCIYLHIFL